MGPLPPKRSSVLWNDGGSATAEVETAARAMDEELPTAATPRRASQTTAAT
jgi:hypothetical protein